jgi:hypothetical protein
LVFYAHNLLSVSHFWIIVIIATPG